MNKPKFYIFFNLLICNLLLSNIIDHQSQATINFNESLELQVFSDYSSEQLIQAQVYFKSDNQLAYLKEDLIKTSDNYFNIIIPPDLISGEYINYYFVFKFNDGQLKTMPPVDPHNNPYSIKVIKTNLNKESTNINNVSLQIAEYEIIAPLNNQKLLEDDVIISLSYFKMKDLNLNKVKIFIDDIDNTLNASIRKNNLFMIPRGLSQGKHEIRVELENKNGEKFNPIIWNFYIADNQSLTDFSVSGKFWNNYMNNQIDDSNSSYNTSNLSFNLNSDIVNIESKFKKSSLENDYSQPYDRYYVKLNLNDGFDIQYGDFYPNLSNFVLNGKRIRGIGLNFTTKWLQLNLINGDFERAVQGDPANNSTIISDYYPCNDDGCTHDYILDVSRNNYAFQKEAKGLSIRFGKKFDGINWGFNLLKVKDDIESVNKNLSGALIAIPTSSPFDNLISDKCIDFVGDGCDGSDVNNNDMYLLEDNDSNGLFNSEEAITNTANVFSNELSCLDETITIEDCADYGDSSLCINGNTYSIYQCHWEIVVEKDNLDNFMIDNNYTDLYGNEIQIVELEDQWTGNKPQDNVTLGTDFYYKSSNNKFSFNSSIAMSLNNNNIWDPVMTLQDLDLLNDTNEDCYYERTYVSTSDVSYWLDCEAYNISDEVITHTLEVENLGLDLNDIPEDFHPENLADYFHWNFNSVPLIPFYNLINMSVEECNLGECGSLANIITESECEENITFIQNTQIEGDCTSLGGTWNGSHCECDWVWIQIDNEEDCAGGTWGNELSASNVVNEILNSPSIAYDLGLSFKVKKHHFHYSIKKIGSEFNSSGNPYIQKDIIEQNFSDKIRLLDNKMYISLKLKKIQSGILDGSSSFNTDKYDMNINYYPGINLPSLSFSVGAHYRKGGEGSMTWNEFSEQCDNDYNNIINISDFNDCYNDWIIYDLDLSGYIEESEYPLFTDTRVNSKTDNYNIGLNQNVNFKRKQNFSINYYHSTKQDLLFEEKNSDTYVSPRSLNSSFNTNIVTTYNSFFKSKFYFSNSEYNFAQDNSEYYQDQRINRLGLGFTYRNNSFLDNVGADITYSKAEGTSQYKQLGFKITTKFIFFDDLNLNMSYRYHNKKQSLEKFYNNIFKINLFYKF